MFEYIETTKHCDLEQQDFLLLSEMKLHVYVKDRSINNQLLFLTWNHKHKIVQ